MLWKFFMNNIDIRKYTKPIGFQPEIKLKGCTNISDITLAKSITLYIHIPFCLNRCDYCGINVLCQFDSSMMEFYTNAIVQEIQHCSHQLIDKQYINGVHFGGGTPSLLSISQIDKIINAIYQQFQYDSDLEIVFEAHPNSLNKNKIDYLSRMKNVKINIGIQTFNKLQKAIVHRYFDENNFNSIIQLIKNKRIEVGIDLIYGLPESTMKSIEEDILHAIDIGISHLSIYPLWIDLSSNLCSNLDKYEFSIPGYSEKKSMYIHMKEILVQNGYKQYSIFHFSKTKNLSYIYNIKQIEGNNWLGFGAGAVSYFNHIIYQNTCDVNKYIDNVNSKDGLVENFTCLNISNEIKRMFAMNLRKVPIFHDQLLSKYGANIIKAFNENLLDFEKKELIKIVHDRILITPDGILNFDYIEKTILSCKSI